MARHSETYSWSSAGGKGGNATVRLLGMGSASSRVGSISEMEDPLDGTWGGAFEKVDVCAWNGFSLSLNQVKDSKTNARHAQKPRYLQLRLGLEVME